ncbi:MAG: ureidoglycolate dehydrogenase [Saccharofermentanales bacterium]|jgi:ureidoglycolate dehydrogenase (NAD+)
MAEEKLILLQADELHALMKNKLMSAGLPDEVAEETANHLTYADLRGIHSHGAVRVEYYSERAAKGGVTASPDLKFEKTGASTGILHGDNGQGHYVANEALPYVIDMAKESGVAVVGVAKCSHTGTLSYYTNKIAEADLFAIAMCQSDPMAVPTGGAEVFYGTNPLAFAAPRNDGPPVTFDMATTVQAWGKILDARSKGRNIPADWAVDSDGVNTTDPHNVHGLLPIAGAKGYGLMMLVDMLSGVLLGVPYGKHVSSMYADLSKGRDLGQLFIAIDPERFVGLEKFKATVDGVVNDLHDVRPATGYDQVFYPGERGLIRYQNHLKNGVLIPEPIVDYLKSDDVHFNNYDGKGIFAE